jgi:CRISPR/Cas system-associated exonuclease Cas4 (RecB family)
MSVLEALRGRVAAPAHEPDQEAVPGGLAALGLQHVSASQLGQYLKCPRQWAYVKVLGLRIPPDGGLVVGSGVHSAAEVGMRAKAASGADPEPEASAEVARDYVREQVATGEVRMEDGQAAGALVDKAARVAEAWARDAAPSVDPVAVEETFDVEISGVHVTGRIDVRTVSEVVDWKTTGKRKSREDALATAQSEVYPAATGKPVRYVYLIDQAKGVSTQEIAQDIGEQHQAARMAEQTVAEVARGMASGVWPRRRDGWHCSAKWCGFHARCMAGRDDDDFAQRAAAARAAMGVR